MIKTEILRLRARTPHAKTPCPLPALFFLTDPERTPDPVAVVDRLKPLAETLPLAVIFRHFGRIEAFDTAKHLRLSCNSVGAKFLIAADADMAEAVKADGVHLPERFLAEAAPLRQRFPRGLITGACHSKAALETANALPLDMVFVSPVLPTRSASGHAPLGYDGFADLAAQSNHPVIALGGITQPVQIAPIIGAQAVAGIDLFFDL